MPERLLQAQCYTVGWVCALPIELAAATMMLDEEHRSLPQDDSDTNVYTLGCIGQRNIVLACLPAGQTGPSSAAAVAIQMKTRFTSILFFLMVGIGGGVASDESDIRLGDVVISQPYMEHGGVVQYDYGKASVSGFVRTGSLNTPPTVLLKALSVLRSNHYLGREKLSTYLSKITSFPDFARADAGSDLLFVPSYTHVGGSTCANCSRNWLVERGARHGQQVRVHYGTIASGSQVIKDGVTRDRLSAELGGVLCFEMEAAGLMNNFPCIAIRGICDYADSHKNKKWQPYAAATAAACAKELLSLLPVAEPAEMRYFGEAVANDEETQPPNTGDGNDQGDIWTKFQRELLVREALDQLRYEYEETEHAFYVIAKLDRNDCLRLIELSDTIRRERRERIRQIERFRSSEPRRSPNPTGLGSSRGPPQSPPIDTSSSSAFAGSSPQHEPADEPPSPYPTRRGPPPNPPTHRSSSSALAGSSPQHEPAEEPLSPTRPGPIIRRSPPGRSPSTVQAIPTHRRKPVYRPPSSTPPRSAPAPQALGTAQTTGSHQNRNIPKRWVFYAEKASNSSNEEIEIEPHSPTSFVPDCT